MWTFNPANNMLIAEGHVHGQLFPQFGYFEYILLAHCLNFEDDNQPMGGGRGGRELSAEAGLTKITKIPPYYY